MMTHRNLRILIALFLVGVTGTSEASAAKLKPKTLEAGERYQRLTETRINGELAGGGSFLVLDLKKPDERASIRKVLKDGGVNIEKMRTPDAGKEIDVEDGMIHHWIGQIFIPKMTIRTLRPWLQNYDRHADYFADVEKSKLLSRDGENFKIYLRLVRKKVITVRYNTEHSVTYRDHSPTRMSSRSIATKIAEIANAGTATEKERTSDDDSGFMWRLNSYWRFQERDGGVWIECEAISLSRDIPTGLGWLIEPIVRGLPSESLANTLRLTRSALVDTAATSNQ